MEPLDEAANVFALFDKAKWCAESNLTYDIVYQVPEEVRCMLDGDD